MDNKIKSCKNCKSFLYHYVKTDRGFIQTVYGHCANINLNVYKNRSCKVCNLWQEKISEEVENDNLKKSLNTVINEFKNIVKTIKE